MFLSTSCDNSSSDIDSSASEKPADTGSSALSYDFITRNRSFMGGSLIYNPDGLNNQLTCGTKIGVRLGILQAIQQTVNTISGIDYSSIPEDVVITLNENDTLENISIEGAELKSEYQVIYQDLPEKAVYGYISIDSVSPEEISLSFTKFSSDGSRSSSSSYTISKGTKCDINGDYIPDLAYDEPPILRAGYGNALYLTFLCDEGSCRTSMFYTFNGKEIQAGYRAAADESEEGNQALPEEGFYGVNSDGHFIFITHQATTPSSAQTFNPVFGDYIVGIATDSDSQTEITGIQASPDSEEENADSQSLTISSNCFTVVSGTSDPKFFSVIDFEKYTYGYDYRPYQFPDSSNGPKALLDALCKNEEIRKAVTDLYHTYKTGELPEASRDVITLLNRILKAKDTVYTIACANGYKDEYEKYESDTSVVITVNTLARRIIDKCYSQSPTADIKSAELANIYPNLYVNIGNKDSISTYPADDFSRSASSTYSDYEAKMKKTNEKWSKFSSFTLNRIRYTDKKNNTKSVHLKNDLGLTLSAGIKGYLSVTSSCLEAQIGAAIYVNLDTNIAQLAANGFLNILLSGLKIGVMDKQIFIGPVPCVYGTEIFVGTLINTDASVKIYFTGLYGGEANFGSKYGIKWKYFVPKPYFSTFASGSAINETEFYIGVDTSSAEIEWEPYVKVIPSFGIGFECVSIRGSVPVTAGLNIKNKIDSGNLTTESAKLKLNASFSPYFEAKVLNIIEIRKTFATLNLMNATLRLYPLPVQWID